MAQPEQPGGPTRVGPGVVCEASRWLRGGWRQFEETRCKETLGYQQEWKGRAGRADATPGLQ